jgi:hypothetical protein
LFQELFILTAKIHKSVHDGQAGADFIDGREQPGAPT